jgi:hypothetical protein
MKIFIVGGGGILGRHLAYRLVDDDNEVHIIDPDVLDIGDNRIISHDNHEAMPTNLHMLVYTRKPDVIIHLGENHTVDPLLVTDYAISNLAITAQVLKCCAQYNIRGFVCGWHILEETNLMTFSLNKKCEMVDFFHRGNCVVNTIHLPHLLHANYPVSGYCTFINRLFSSIYHKQPFFIDESEERIFKYETISVSSINYAVESITALLSTRTRDSMLVPGYRITPKKFFGTALDVFDQESIILVGRNDPREFTRYRKSDTDTVRKWIREAWKELIDSEGTSW